MSIYLSFTFDYRLLISFVVGIGFGIVLFFLLYMYGVIRNVNRKTRRRKVDEADIDEQEIRWMIEDAQKQFKDKEKRNEVGFMNYLVQILKELSVDISKKFYPKSKYPYLELTVDETIKLNHYITDRVDELLKGKILGMTRGFTLARIVEISTVKSKVDNSKVMKAAKQYSQITKAALAVVNAINPVYWIKRLTKETAVNIVMVRIGLALIGITGEETYKIYSKKVFDVEKTIDTGVDDIYEQLAEDFKEAGDDK